MEQPIAKSNLIIPNRLVSPVDLGRVRRDLVDLDDSLHQASIRTPGSAVQLPRTTRMIEDLAEVNRKSLLDSSDRQMLIGSLAEFSKKPPLIHLSFSVEPSADFVEKIIVWLRNNIHPQLLVDLGLQPTITAGCVIRTPSKVFDLSLRNNIAKMTPLLLEKIGGRTS